MKLTGTLPDWTRAATRSGAPTRSRCNPSSPIGTPAGRDVVTGALWQALWRVPYLTLVFSVTSQPHRVPISARHPSTTRCTPGAPVGCRGNKSRCLTHDLWEELGNQIHLYLSSVSLADVCEKRVLATSGLVQREAYRVATAAAK